MKVKTERQVTQSCPILSDPMDCSLPGSSIHGIFQARVLQWGVRASRAKSGGPLPMGFFKARVLEWGAIAFSGGKDRLGQIEKVALTYIHYHV